MRILNLYGALGGNSELWDDESNEITHVELNKKIAAVTIRRKPKQRMIIADAHQFLLDHYKEYDFVWSSPPCQKHSKMNKFTRHNMVRYIDGKLIEEIIFLETYFKGKWVVENVVPYYKPYGNPVKIGWHLFWSNFPITDFKEPKQPKNFINEATVSGKKLMMDWLGIHFEENIYYEGNHCPAQVLRNCVHPQIGLHVLNCALIKSKSKQLEIL